MQEPRENCEQPGVDCDMRCGGSGAPRGAGVFAVSCVTHSYTAGHASSAGSCYTVNMWPRWRTSQARAGGRSRCAVALSHARATLSLSLCPSLSLCFSLSAALCLGSYPENRGIKGSVVTL